MPSEIFPEFATRKRSAETRLCGEVTATPPALLRGRDEEARLRSTTCNVVQAGLLQSTVSMLTNGNCERKFLVVTQFHGSQRNCSFKCRLRMIQLDHASGWNSLIRISSIRTPFCESLSTSMCCKRPLIAAGATNRTSLAP